MRSVKRNLICFVLLLVIMSILTTSVYAKNYVWRCMIPAAGCWDTFHWQDLADGVKAVTNGQLEIKIFVPGEHPYKLADFLKAVSKGECEIAGLPGGYVSSIEPGLAVLELPLLVPDGNFEIQRKLYTEFRKGYYKDILDKWRVHEIITTFWGGQQFYLKEGWIENANSLKGKKVRSWSGEVSNFVKLLGGIPVTIPLGENYTALQTGLLDATTTSFSPAYRNKIMEVCKHVVMSSAFFCANPYVVNNKAWDALPAELQKTVKEYFESKREWFETGSVNADGADLQLAFITDNIEARALPKAYRRELTMKAYDAIWKPWIERSGEKGKEAFDMAIKTIREMGYEVPVSN